MAAYRDSYQFLRIWPFQSMKAIFERKQLGKTPPMLDVRFKVGIGERDSVGKGRGARDSHC